MRKSTAVASAASIIIAVLVVLGWYWASPFYAVASLRDAALRRDTKDLAERVDFPHLREGIKAQFTSFLIERTARDLRENPFAAVGVALAAKLTDVMVDAMVTPVGIAALLEPDNDRAPDEVSGMRLMLSSEIVVRRDGFGAFDFYAANQREKKPALRFSRDGLNWRLVGIHIPNEFLVTKIGDAVGGSQPTAPYVPRWESRDRKDPMDDTVSVYLSRGADEEVNARFSKVRPMLIFRCQKNKLDAYINVRSSVEFDYQTYSTNVRLRFDDNPPRRESWGVSDDREALFAPSPTVFLRSLLNAASVRIEWHPLGGGVIVARFTRDDLEAHAARLANRCGKPGLTQTLQEPISYAVPIGAFVSADKVRQLRAMLTANGIESYTEELRTRKGPVTRVRLGPYSSREAAETARDKIVAMGLRPGDVTERYQGE
jgi:hypothetical protein